jgi:hypothetical protein
MYDILQAEKRVRQCFIKSDTRALDVSCGTRRTFPLSLPPHILDLLGGADFKNISHRYFQGMQNNFIYAEK